MPLAKLGKIQLYYEVAGSGPAIVFIHGFTLDHRMWRRQVEFFSGAYSVITYDSRGHGKSSCPATGYSRADRVRDLKKLVEYLKCRPFHIVGLSMGGATALGYAIDFPDDLLSLTLVDSAVSCRASAKNEDKIRKIALTEGVEAAKRRWVELSLFYYANRNEALRRELAEIIGGHCGHLWLDRQWRRYDDRNDLELSGDITVPTMIFAGEKDQPYRLLAEALHRNIRTSEIDIIPNVGHMVNMEAPERFNLRLEQFLERVGMAGRSET